MFDKDGKYLYFCASTDSGPSLQPDIHSFSRPVSRSIYLLVLSKDESSPLAPESDDEKDEESQKKTRSRVRPNRRRKKQEAKCREGRPAEKPGTTPKPVDVKIDFENIGQRILALPMPPRRYMSLQVGKPGVLYAVEVPAIHPGAESPERSGALTVHRYDLKSRKSDVAIGGVRSFEISHNGEKMLYRQGDRWLIAALRPMPYRAWCCPPPPPPLQPRCRAAGAEDRRLRSEGGSQGSLEADVSRSVADPARLFL